MLASQGNVDISMSQIPVTLKKTGPVECDQLQMWDTPLKWYVNRKNK